MQAALSERTCLGKPSLQLINAVNNISLLNDTNYIVAMAWKEGKEVPASIVDLSSIVDDVANTLGDALVAAEGFGFSCKDDPDVVYAVRSLIYDARE